MKGVRQAIDRHLRLLAALAGVFCITVPVAQADSGLYIGGSIGNGLIELAPDVIVTNEFDESDMAWKVLGGYNFDLLVIDLAIEGSYLDLGNPVGTISGNTATFSMDGYTATGLLGLELGPIGVFGKAGLFNWDASYSIPGVTSGADSSSDPIYGLGARFSIGSAELRAEFEYFDIDIPDFSTSDFAMASVGVVWTF